MEEDNTQYYNDEWNNKPTESYRLEIWDFKESGVEIYTLEEYRQLGCMCHIPRPNSFTGNCTNCNKIIKPIIDKDADKHTK